MKQNTNTNTHSWLPCQHLVHQHDSVVPVRMHNADECTGACSKGPGDLASKLG